MVPPHSDLNCENNVTFKNVNFDFSLKAIYVKTKFFVLNYLKYYLLFIISKN